MADKLKLKQLENELIRLRGEVDRYRETSKKRLDGLESGTYAYDLTESVDVQLKQQIALIQRQYGELERSLRAAYAAEERKNREMRESVENRLTEETEKERGQAQAAIDDIYDYCGKAEKDYPFGNLLPGAILRYKTAVEEAKGFFKNGLYQSVIGAVSGLKLRIELDICELETLSGQWKRYSASAGEALSRFKQTASDMRRVDKLNLSEAFYEDEGVKFDITALDYWTGGDYSAIVREAERATALTEQIANTDNYLLSTQSSFADVTVVYSAYKTLRNCAERLDNLAETLADTIGAYDVRMYEIAPRIDGAMSGMGFVCEEDYLFRSDNGAAGKKDALRLVYGDVAVDIFPIYNQKTRKTENHIGVELETTAANAASVAKTIKNKLSAAVGGYININADYALAGDNAPELIEKALTKAVNTVR